jgi:hypothetical protein
VLPVPFSRFLSGEKLQRFRWAEEAHQSLESVFFSSRIRDYSMIFIFCVERLSLFDSIEIEPRPVSSVEEIHPRPIKGTTLPVIVAPTPCAPCAHPAQQIAETAIESHTLELADLEHEVSESDILLQAIVAVARKEQTRVTRGALRDLVRKFAHQYSLDF